MGLRTVDTRSGRRVALWRTLTLVLAQAATDAIGARVAGAGDPIPSAEHERYGDDLRVIQMELRDDPEARDRALTRFYEERRLGLNPDVRRMLAGIAGSALLNQWLRRRLAPTIVVAAPREWASHRP